jgi:hypothetical protein
VQLVIANKFSHRTIEAISNDFKVNELNFKVDGKCVHALEILISLVQSKKY